MPFLLWSILKVALYQSLTMENIAKVFLHPDGYFWFLWVLYWIQVAFLLGDWIASKLHIKQEIVIIIFCLIFATLMVLADVRFFGFQFFAYYFMFYTFGNYLHKHERLMTKNNYVVLALSVLWAVMAWFWNMHELPLFLSKVPVPSSLLQYVYRFVTALVAVYVIIAISPKLLNKDELLTRPFIWMGRVSLGLYVFHLLFIADIAKATMSFVSAEWLGVLLTFIIALSITCLAVWLLNQWKISARFLLGKIGKI